MATVFTLGLAASFAPCLFPVLPSYVSFLTKTDTRKLKTLFTAGLTTLGIMTVFVTFGVFVSTFSNLLNFFGGKNYLVFRFWQGIILVFLGILLSKKITVGSAKLEATSSRVQDYLTRVENPYLLSYLIGIFFAVLAAPCAIVVFGSFFFILESNPGIANAVILSSLFSLAAGFPFLLMGVLIPSLKESVLENSEKIFNIMPVIAGVIIILNGIYLSYDAWTLGYSPFSF
ncbi:MAG: cytochrome c biogenesis CcdA family protein [Candidatus Heimdallarchaeota archaeon]